MDLDVKFFVSVLLRRKLQARRIQSKDNVLILEPNLHKILCISYFKKAKKIPEIIPCLQMRFEWLQTVCCAYYEVT